MTPRKCGSCTLCCKLLPVNEGFITPAGRVDTFVKPAMTRCEHQCSKGCRVYDKRPEACRLWSCAWLAGGVHLPRPDHGHYAVDVCLDVITGTDGEGAPILWKAVQVWVDPDHPDAWGDARLGRYLTGMAQKHGTVAIIRGANEKTRTGKGIVLLPPEITGEAGWVKIESDMDPTLTEEKKIGLLRKLMEEEST